MDTTTPLFAITGGPAIAGAAPMTTTANAFPLAVSLGLALGGCEATGRSDDGAVTTTARQPGGEETDGEAVAETSAVPPSEDTSTGGSGPDGGAEADPSPIVFDHGPIPDAPPVADSACHKVDFLFVIDNSSSMGPHQTNLVNSFPGFIDGILGTLDSADSYQVGVVTTDAYSGNAPGCTGLSSLVVQTAGDGSSNMVCGPYATGVNYMTEADDLASSFTCAAQVGSSGASNEQPMLAIIEAVQRVEGGPGQCNDGFLRDDSLLVIVGIGDEYDNSPGTPASWYDDIVAARSGLPDNIIVMSIIDGPDAGCDIYPQSWDRSEFTALWGARGFEVPICAPDYGPFFDEAIGIIDEACENFVPPAG